MVARYGGEEFVAFFPQTTPSEALIAAEHIREAIEEMEIQTKEHVISVTVSIGISDCRSFNLNALIKQADEALYNSKENGRNRTTLYQDVISKKIKESQLETDDANTEGGSIEK